MSCKSCGAQFSCDDTCDKGTPHVRWNRRRGEGAANDRAAAATVRLMEVEARLDRVRRVLTEIVDSGPVSHVGYARVLLKLLARNASTT